MRKKLITFVVLVVTAAVIVAAVVGCGSKASSIGDPIEFFNQAKDKTQAATSIALSGKLSMKTAGSSQQLSILPANIDIPLTGTVQNSDSNQNATLTFDVSFINSLLQMFGLGGATTSGKLNVYVVQGKVYLQSPLDGSWFVLDTSQGVLANLPKGQTPEQGPGAALSAIQNIQVQQETSAAVIYTVTMNPDQLVPSYTGDVLKAIEPTLTDSQVAGMVSDLKAAISRLATTITVDKKSGYVTEAAFTLTGVPDSLGVLSGGLLPTGDDKTLSADIKLSDFGKQVQINLPAGANNATPETLEKLLDLSTWITL